MILEEPPYVFVCFNIMAILFDVRILFFKQIPNILTTVFNHNDLSVAN